MAEAVIKIYNDFEIGIATDSVPYSPLEEMANIRSGGFITKGNKFASKVCYIYDKKKKKNLKGKRDNIILTIGRCFGEVYGETERESIGKAFAQAKRWIEKNK